jgi:hypothetical protein
MTIAAANLATSDTFQTWLTKTNVLLDALSNTIVTVSTSTFGNTTGNGYVNGIFGSATLIANTALRGGNVTVSNTLNITSAVSVQNTFIVSTALKVGNTTSNVQIVSNVASVATVTPTIVDSFPATEGKMVRYVVGMQNAANSLVYMCELLLVHDSTSNVYMTKYGEIYNSVVLGTFDAAVNGANVELKVTAINTTSYSVKSARMQF